MNAWAFTPASETEEEIESTHVKKGIVIEKKNASGSSAGSNKVLQEEVGGAGGITQILSTIGETFAPSQVIGYRALNQYDPELGLAESDSYCDIINLGRKVQKSKINIQKATNSVKSSNKNLNNNNNKKLNCISTDSSDLEELFPKTNNKRAQHDKKKIFRHQRKARRKMTAKTYTLSGNRENQMQTQMKNYKLRITLGVIVALVMIAGVAVGLYFLLRDDVNETTPDDDKNTVQLADILNGQLAVTRFNSSWSDGTNLIYRHDGTIVEYNTKTKRRTILLHDELRQYFSYEKSADGQLLLLGKQFKKNFRHSYVAEYEIFNLTSGQVYPLTIKGHRTLMLAQWAPVDNALIVNYDLNLYYKASAFAQEVTITNDLSSLRIFNGVPDWVYEEEVVSGRTVTWFNPNGSQIAFLRLDDSPTPSMSLPYYGEAGDSRFQYPLNRQINYPKAGAPNPRVQLFTADLVRAAQGLGDFLTEIPVPSALNTESDYIVSTVGWLNNDNVLSVWMNRIQNVAYLQTFSSRSRFEIYNIESKTGWVDIFQSPLRNRDGSRIALILPQKIDNYGDYKHLCLLSTVNANSRPDFLTKGRFVVEAILHWDPSTDVIFYTANTEKEPHVLHLFAIKASSGQVPKCLTCKLHISGGVEQTYYSTEFNDGQKIVINSLGPGIPMTSIYEYKWANNQLQLTKLLDWETNDVLRAKLADLAMPTTEIHTFPIADGFTARVLMNLPPNMDRSGRTKYPMLIDVYGGPESYSAKTRFVLDWGTYLTSNQKVIYAQIDGRGSGMYGDKILHSIYLKLGTLEIQDQINVTRQMQEKFPFIDANHTAIWGWSYGGYAAAMALANDNSNVFSCAASIAPVTDWALYDSVYTERYMSLPNLNPSGYANSRLSTRATKLRDRKFLLVHGTLDDNVHYQQSLVLAKNLERNDILFKQISYTDEDHGLAAVRPHLYHSLDRYLGECFEHKRLLTAKH